MENVETLDFDKNQRKKKIKKASKDSFKLSSICYIIYSSCIDCF